MCQHTTSLYVTDPLSSFWVRLLLSLPPSEEGFGPVTDEQSVCPQTGRRGSRRSDGDPFPSMSRACGATTLTAL